MCSGLEYIWFVWLNLLININVQLKKLLMKKTYILIVLVSLLTTVSLIGQNLMNNGDLEDWDNSTTPTNWDLYDNVSQESTIVYEGIYSAAQMSADASQKLRQDVYNIVGGQQYIISYYYLDNSPAARTRIWSYWMENGTYLDDDEEQLRPSVYSEDNPEWQHYSVTLTAPLNANEFRFDVRTYKQDGNTGGLIYFDDFSVDGEIIIYPEPSNYPAIFIATASGLSIDVTWAESTGDQIPTGYLLLGEKSTNPSFEIPVDGIPVENDLDWSDNKVSVNVGYGVGEYTFDGLATNSGYSFTIFPFTNTGTDIDYKTDGNPPTASATTANVSVINYEPFENSLGAWWQYSVIGDQIWEWANYGDPPGCAKGNGYDGGPIENEDWLISPELDLTGFSSITFGFDHARNYASNDGLFVLISTDYAGSGDPNIANWNDITSSYTFPDPGSWTFFDAGISDISSYNSEAVYIAFLYSSTSSDASTWEIDNAEVLGVLNTGLGENKTSKLEVYPNPASNRINIKVDDQGIIRIMTITGQLLIESEIVDGNNSIDIETLNSGLYIIETISINGARSIGKLTVQ